MKTFFRPRLISRSLHFFGCLILPSLALLPTLGHSQSVSWNTSEEGSWFEEENWNPAAIPTSANDVLIAQGAAVIDNSGAEAKKVTVSGSAVLHIGDPNTPGSGSLQAEEVILDGSDATLTFNQTNAITFSAAISGTGHIVHQGSGTTTLTGNSWEFAGQVDVASGVLILDQDALLSGNIAVKNGATLGGSGIFKNVTLESGATMTVTNCLDGDTLTWNGGATIVLGIGSETFNLIELSSLVKGTDGAFAFTFEDYGWQIGETYMLINFSEDIGLIGFSAGDFSYTNGGDFQGIFTLDETSLSFTLNVIPEPSAWALLGLGLGVLFLVKQKAAFRHARECQQKSSV